MPGIDKATGRAVALIVLLVVGGAALHGYIPDPHSAERPVDHPASAPVVVVLLGAALAILALAVVSRIREHRSAAGDLHGLAEGAVGAGRRTDWRVMLIGLGLLAGWLLLMVVLVQLAGHHVLIRLPLPGSPTDTTGTDTAQAETPPAAPRPRPGQREPAGDMLGYLVVAGVGMLLVTVAAMVIGRRRGRPRAAVSAAPAERCGPDAPSSAALVRAAELGLAEIGNLDRGPREAIIACYATMERELARVPDVMPQDCDTPTEVLVRAVEHRALRADNATQLVELFAEARFSPHVMNEGHRDAAVRVLRLVLAELPRSRT